MNEENRSGNILLRTLFAVGPGLFCVGYTIGTGSVTSMIVAGSEHGMKLLWVLALSCLFSGVLMEAFGRYAVVTGKTSIETFRDSFGTSFAILVAVMVVLGQWSCLTGLVGLSSHAILEGVGFFVPGIDSRTVVLVALVMLSIVYLCIWFGNYKRFETILVLLVTVMGLSFMASLFFVHPTAGQAVEGFVPRIPDSHGAYLMVAAFVGTTMAAPTFVVRPILLKSKGWTEKDRKIQTRDVIVSASVMFLISASIMACSTGAILNRGGSPVRTIADMVETLRPLAGDFAAGIFLVGVVAAGLSSIFPILMVAPFLLSDYRSEKPDARKPAFRILAAVACLIGLTVPVLGASPVFVQILTQTAQVFVLPLIIVAIAILVNRRGEMRQHRSGALLNTALAAAFLFSLVIVYCAVVAVGRILLPSCGAANP